MKCANKILVFIGLTLCLFSCKPVFQEQQAPTVDSLMTHMMRAILDTNVSCLDYKDEFMMFMDTMQMHVESYPNEDIRIGAKSFAMELFGLFEYGNFTTPDEKRFFDDSLLSRLRDIQSTWYMPEYVSDGISDPLKEPVLMQTIVFRYSNNENHVICMDLYFFPSGDEEMAVTLPIDAEKLQSIMFGNNEDIDFTQLYRIREAIGSQERSEDFGQVILFGKDFIDAMLSHDVMYIVYKGTENSEEIIDNLHSCNLMLLKFHEQYQQVKQLMNK